VNCGQQVKVRYFTYRRLSGVKSLGITVALILGGGMWEAVL